MKRLGVISVLILGGLAAYFYVRKPADAGKELASTTGNAQVVRLYTWANYIDPEVYADFEREFGIKVIEENFDSNEMLRSRLQVSPDAYDVIVPSDFIVSQLVADGLLAELNLAKIPNRANLAPEFQNLKYDPGQNHVVPYLWGTVGIGYRADKMTEAPTSWGDYLMAEKVALHANRISMLDSPREGLGVALKMLGFSVNSKNPEEIEKAKKVLLEQKRYLGRYDSETFDDFLITGDLNMALGWSGEIAKAAVGHPELKYVVPSEGSIIWADNLAVPSAAKNKAGAEEFINYIHRPEVSAKIVNYIHYPSPNLAAQKLIKSEILQDTNLYPSTEMMAKFEWLEDLGEANALYENAWAEVKAHTVN